MTTDVDARTGSYGTPAAEGEGLSHPRKPLGLYVHIPFCVRKCAYCDFCSQPPTGDIIDRYFDRLARELDAYRREPRIPVDTLFIGGGTPSILPVGYHTRLYNMLADTFDLAPLTEYTVEVNPGTLTPDKAREYKSLGVNRISIGLQSIHENELKKLGRIHSYGDFLASFNMLRTVGIDNISVDLMYGIPEQAMASFAETLDTVIALDPSHISVYGLIVEDGTPFGDDPASLSLPSEDEECDMYEHACLRLARAGYRHYEISNYARAGGECQHNLKYWRCEEYLGIGAAAHSYFDGARFGNGRDILSVTRDGTLTDDGDREYEYIMMHLRLSDGFSLTDYKERFGCDFRKGREKQLAELVRLGLMRLDGERISLTERGFYVSNSILVNFL